MLFVALVMATLSPMGDCDINLEHYDVSSGVSVDMLLPAHLLVETTEEIEPGILPEGDYLYDLAWSADGQTVLVANYITKNLSLISQASGTVIADIPTNGLRPGAVATCANYTVTAFPFDDLVAITDETGTMLGTVSTGEQPWRIVFSPDGETAYIGCDINDECLVIDLSTQTVLQTIENFPFWLQTFGWGSESPRNYITFSTFTVTEDGEYLTVPNGEDAVLFFNTTTGLVDHTVNVPDANSVALSGDGSKLIVMAATSNVTLYQIDIASFAVTESVTVTGNSPGMTREIAVNQDGTKAYISTSNNTSTLVNFTNQNFTQFTSTYSAFWTGANFDHTLAISGQYRFSVIDFETETMVAQYQGNSQYLGETSPVANLAAGMNPVGHEGLYFYSFTNSSVNYLGDVLSGSPVEGDAPRRVAISPDGNWAVVSNTLSDNASLIDLNALQTIAVLDIGDRVQNVKFTPDSRYAVICGFNSNSIKIIDTQTATVVANVPTGTRPGVIDINHDGTMACVGNISSNTVSFVELNGAASTEVAEKSCGTIGVTWAGYGVSSGVVISPDGSIVLVCDSFNDNIRLYSMSDYTEIAVIPVGDFPLQAAFNADGSRAMVTCYTDDKVYLLDIDGASSSVLGNWASGDGPLRIAYDQTENKFAVGLIMDDQVRFYSAEDGAYLGMESFPEGVLQPAFAQNGDLFTLTSSSSSNASRLYRESDFTELPATGCTFDYNNATNRVVIAIPGPDIAYVIQYTTEGIETNPISLSNIVSVNPNPVVSNQVTFGFTLAEQTIGELAIFDLTGRKVTEIDSGDFSAGTNSITTTTNLPTGTYAVKFSAPNTTIIGRFSIIN